MNIRRLITYLAVATIALWATACNSLSHNPNVVSFGTGATVGYTTKNQFLSIATDFAWSIDIEYISPEGASDWCKLNKTEGEGNANVIMTFGENKLDEDRSLKLIVTFPNESVELLFTQLSALSQNNQGDLSGWLELPKFEADQKQYYFSKHMLPSKNNQERSFSIFYDADIYHPLWIAYPLCRGNINGTGSRQDAWGIFDPNIPTEKQLYMSRSYYSNYDRGHMLPSASRLGSDEDNRQTFYPTNMSPQLSGLNQKKWASIEGQVRNWGEGCDTLYVVTGAVFKTVGGNESVSFTQCRSDNSKDVAIPNYYYKALLQLRQGSYYAMAIWVPHKAASGVATLDDVITIDRLEELTGLDFFHNLSDNIEATVESTIDNTYWGLK